MKKIIKLLLVILLLINNHSITYANENKDDILVSHSDATKEFLSLDMDGNVTYYPIEDYEEIIEDEDYQVEIITDNDSFKQSVSSKNLMLYLSLCKTPFSEVNVYGSDSGELKASDEVSVVRFKKTSTVIYYNEEETNIQGYTSGAAAADGAYLGMVNGKVRFKLAGVVGLVDPKYVEIVPYTSKLNLSYYKVVNDELFHYISTDINASSHASVSWLGQAPTYLQTDKKYYSYDGHYFYDDYIKMIKDYQDDIYSNAKNPTNPYYSYYQYVSIRQLSLFSADDYNTRIDNGTKVSTSKLKNSGELFYNTKKYGVNSVIALGIAINESGWGNSSIAQNKNNLFGLNAIDVSPGTSSSTFASVEACINDFAKNWLSNGFLSPLDERYYGPHLGDKQSGLNVKYASDPYWGEKAASQCNYLDHQVGYKDYQMIAVDAGIEKHYIYSEPSDDAKYFYRNGNYSGKVIKQFPFTVIERLVNDEGIWYKVLTDGVIKEDHSSLDTSKSGLYHQSYCYGYIKASDSINVVNKGLSNLNKATYFTDLNSKEWYYSVVSKMVSRGFMSGVSDKIFAPNTNMSRAMVITTIHNMEQYPSMIKINANFDDVKNGLWYSNAISWGSGMNIINGSNNKFKPDDNILRQDLAVILRNYVKSKGIDTNCRADLSKFEDYKNIDDYALSALEWANAKGIITGSNDLLNPKNNATRAECCKMLWLTYELIQRES